MEKYAQEAAAEVAREMDREILWGMLESMGWTRVMLPRLINREQSVDIMQWLNVHCKYPHEHHGRDFIFENDKDAMWFKLKWFS